MRSSWALILFLIVVIVALPVLPANAQETIGSDCIENQTLPCGSNIGACQQGIRTCDDGQWSECMNEIAPETEICTNKIDDDCDGNVDECGPFLWMIVVGIGLLLFSFGIAIANKWTD